MIIFNCTTNIMGGGKKNAVLFIKHSVKYPNYVYFVHECILEELQGVDIPDSRLYVFKKSPAKCMSTRKEIAKLANEISPDVFYTMSGPSYVKVKALSVCGISDGFVTHSSLNNFFNFMPISLSIKALLNSVYKCMHLRYNDYLIFQTETAAKAFRKRAFFKYNEKIISNAFDNGLLKSDLKKDSLNDGKVEILVPGSDYWHKGYEQIIPIINNHQDFLDEYQIEFVFTLPSDSGIFNFIKSKMSADKVDKYIVNKGKYSYSSISSVYDSADFVFVPSNLETFSAHYLEAFCFGKPLIVTDTDFAIEICSDSAVAVEQNNPEALVETLKSLIENKEKCREKVSAGYEFLDSMYSQEERVDLINTFLESISVS